MTTYLVLLRGVNVGGKNLVSMATLKKCLEEADYQEVRTYIASGNVIVRSKKSAKAVQTQIEKLLPKKFKLHSEFVKVLVLTRAQLQAVVTKKPKGFGAQPKKFHSDAIFLMEGTAAKVMTVFSPKEGVDRVWLGKGVVYSQRLSAKRTQSRLGKIVGTPAYKSMTIRSWSTTTKLLELMHER